MLMVLLKKTDYATVIATIKNDYATKEILDSKINDLKVSIFLMKLKK